ncbi:MAG: lamin tail domain-containing protein, partial [Planctomycetota bacterium]|nr:lamin tail domain-containing protein [Planctomycetota bacterium]
MLSFIPRSGFGQTVQAEVGGMGRPVTGVLKPPASDGSLVYLGHLNVPEPVMPLPANWTSMTEGERHRYAQKWDRTPEGKALKQRRAGFYVGSPTVSCPILRNRYRGATIGNVIIVDLEDLQWIELYNSGKEAVDLSGWSLARGVTFAIPAGTEIKPDGYLVVARKPTLFGQHYRVQAIGGFDSALKHGASYIELLDAKGQVIDMARYKDRDPWPLSPDGYSSSVERICPTASGEKAENWAPSPLPANVAKPSGTPGARNSCYSENLPPTITKVTCTPGD